jgi:hypothetical protein
MTRLADNPLVRMVRRVPITVQRKLLIAFGIVVVLLVTVGVLGISVLNESNDRVDSLGLLPQRQAAYRELAIDSESLNQLLLLRNEYVACLSAQACAAPGGASGFSYSLAEARTAEAQTDGAIDLILNQVSLLTNVGNLGFVPPRHEQSILTKIHSEYVQLDGVVVALLAGDVRERSAVSRQRSAASGSRVRKQLLR